MHPSFELGVPEQRNDTNASDFAVVTFSVASSLHRVTVIEFNFDHRYDSDCQHDGRPDTSHANSCALRTHNDFNSYQ